VNTKRPDAQLGRAGYSIYPLPIGCPFHPYAAFDHRGEPDLDFAGLELPVPTEQQWLELNNLAGLADRAGFWVTLTQMGPGQPLHLTTTPKGYWPDERGIQWSDAERFKAYIRAGHFLHCRVERRRLAVVAVEEAEQALSPRAYAAWVREHLEPWQAWGRLNEWEAASQYPAYCFALRRVLEADPLLLAA
jgi:hypothetical protein